METPGTLRLWTVPQLLDEAADDMEELLAADASGVLRSFMATSFWTRFGYYLKDCAAVFYRDSEPFPVPNWWALVASLHRRLSSSASEAWPIRGWTELNERLKGIAGSKLMERVLVRANPNKTGGHDPDVARQLLKPGPLPNRGAMSVSIQFNQFKSIATRGTASLSLSPRYPGVQEARTAGQSLHEVRDRPKVLAAPRPSICVLSHTKNLGTGCSTSTLC